MINLHTKLFNCFIIHGTGRACSKNREKGMIDVGGGGKGRLPSTNSCAINHRASFLPVEYCRSYEHHLANVGAIDGDVQWY